MGETPWENVLVWQYAHADDGTLAGDDPVLDRSETDNDLEFKSEAEERKLHRMAKVHNILEMWQGSQNLRTTQKESRAQDKQMTAVGYISDTEESVKACGHFFNRMVRLHLNCRKDYCCHQLCLQRNSQEDELKY